MMNTLFAILLAPLFKIYTDSTTNKRIEKMQRKNKKNLKTQAENMVLEVFTYLFLD